MTRASSKAEFRKRLEDSGKRGERIGERGREIEADALRARELFESLEPGFTDEEAAATEARISEMKEAIKESHAAEVQTPDAENREELRAEAGESAEAKGLSERNLARAERLGQFAARYEPEAVRALVSETKRSVEDWLATEQAARETEQEQREEVERQKASIDRAMS